MFDTPLVSIITPSFNQSRYLEACIQSVLNQNYSNIEYIVIDGGSTDGSKEIIEKYTGQLAYWQSKPDGGQTKALNIGYEKSRGQIVAYLNADDLLQPGAVESAVRCFEVNRELAFVHGACNTIDEEGNELKAPEGDLVSHEFLLHTGMLPRIYQPATFFNRQLIKRPFFVDETYHYAFDYELLLFLIRKGTDFFINKHFACYRIHPASKTALGSKQAYAEKLSIQQKYGSKYFMKWQLKKLSFNLKNKVGR